MFQNEKDLTDTNRRLTKGRLNKWLGCCARANDCGENLYLVKGAV